MNDAVLRFGGAKVDDTVFESASPSSQVAMFGMWLGAVYAMEHEVAVDPNSLAAFDPVSVMPLYREDAERARTALELPGLTIEQSWLSNQLILRRPSTCVIVDRFTDQPLDRITRLRVSTAQALVDELINHLARNFRFEGRLAWVAAFEDAYFEAAPPISAGVLVGQGGHSILFMSANPLTRELFYVDPWPTGTLVPGGEPGGQGGEWRISAEALVDVIVYTMIEDTPPVERSADIYARTVRHEANPAVGAPLDVAWHASWQFSGPTFCLVAEGRGAGSIERIPYRAELPAAEIVAILAQAFRTRPESTCVGHVRLDIDRGHSILLQHVDDADVKFHDPWPGGSLLAAGCNSVDVAAQTVQGGWRITPTELERCLEGVFISPESLAELQGREYRQRLSDVMTKLAFFNVHETSRSRRDDNWEVEAQTGGFNDKVRIRFAVDDEGWLEAALLCVESAWLNGPDRPFGIDIVKSFLAATVSPLDRDEAQMGVRAVEAIARGLKEVQTVVGSGAPHLLGQARALVATVLGAQDNALCTYLFTRVAAVSGEWLQVGIERSGRSPGPFLVGASLPAPWDTSPPV